jgi:hypothetical protein
MSTLKSVRNKILHFLGIQSEDASRWLHRMKSPSRFPHLDGYQFLESLLKEIEQIGCSSTDVGEIEIKGYLSFSQMLPTGLVPKVKHHFYR